MGSTKKILRLCPLNEVECNNNYRTYRMLFETLKF